MADLFSLKECLLIEAAITFLLANKEGFSKETILDYVNLLAKVRYFTK